MVNDQIHRHHRVDLFRVAAQAGHRRAHGSQIDYRGHTGKVLHDHTGGQEGDARAFALRRPGSDVLDIILGDLALVTLTQRRFEHDSDRKREPLEVGQTRLFQRVEAIIRVSSVIGLEGITGIEKVLHNGLLRHSPSPLRRGVGVRWSPQRPKRRKGAPLSSFRTVW